MSFQKGVINSRHMFLFPTSTRALRFYPDFIHFLTRRWVSRTAVQSTKLAAGSRMAEIVVHPRVSLVDEELQIQVKGLRSFQKVTIQANVEENKVVFTSCGHFLADQRGSVDTTRDPSHGGTYTGLDSMGLFWSMKPISKKTMIIINDVTRPMLFHLKLMDSHVDFKDLQLPSSVGMATITCERWYKHKDVQRVVVREGRLRGTLFLPPGPGPFPGIIDMFGFLGGLIETRAALLASKGFVTLALGYIAYDDLVTKLEDLDLSYFLEAADWLCCHPNVVSDSVGVVGFSKGGELAFAMGRASNKIKAIVNISGTPSMSFEDLKRGDSVILKGVPLHRNKIEATDDGVISRNAFPNMEELITPVWESDAHILYLVGEDDKTWNTKNVIDAFMQQCPKDKRDKIELVLYPNAGHLIDPPYMPLCRTSFVKSYDFNVLWGGSPEGHAAAQKHAWKRLVEFLHTHLRHPGQYVSSRL